MSNPKIFASLAEGKDSLGESFVDAKKDLLSATSPGGSHLKDSLNANDASDYKQSMEIDRNISNRKRKTTEYDGNGSNFKLAQ